ncbi:hypothetical protein BT69DRAFT_576403 [Atractiella rhizophila]|nr:hypothetical protein BT69DRAFT_576403 [Atractiella rhizophila]
MVALLNNASDTASLQPACRLLKLMTLRLAICLPPRLVQMPPQETEEGEPEAPPEPVLLPGALNVMAELATSMSVLMEDNDQTIRHTSTMIYNDLELHQRITDVRDLHEISVTDFDSLLELFKSKRNLIVSWACTAMGMILETDPKEEFLQPRFLKPMVALLKYVLS